MKKIAHLRNADIVKAESKDDFEEYEYNPEEPEWSTFVLKGWEGEDVITKYNGELPALFWCEDSGERGYDVVYYTKNDLLNKLSKYKTELLREIKSIEEASEKVKVQNLAEI